MNDLLEAFNRASGLDAHHIAIHYHPNLELEFDGYDQGEPFHIVSGPILDDLHRAATVLGILHKNRIFQKLEQELKQKPMGKLADVAHRIADTKKRLEAQADELSVKLDGVEKKAPDAFARGHAVLDQHSADLDTMDAELRQLSNIPLPG